MNPYVDELTRLRTANPAPVEPDRGQTSVATATLARILHEPIDEAIDARSTGRPSARSRGRRIATWSSRRLGVVLAVAVTLGGGAFAATDPLGWWSANPTDARYGSNPAVHVRTPAARQIACSRSGEVLHCAPAMFELPSGIEFVNGHRSTAQLYTFIDAIRPPAQGFTRETLLAYIARRRTAGTLSAARAARLRADIAAVPDSFFTEYLLGTRYGTYSVGAGTRRGLTLAPPPGTPSFVVCEPAGRGLSCQTLNGDEHAPIGAGVYGARPARTWRYERVSPLNFGLPPGFSFTRAEYRLLNDMISFVTATHRRGTM